METGCGRFVCEVRQSEGNMLLHNGQSDLAAVSHTPHTWLLLAPLPSVSVLLQHCLEHGLILGILSLSPCKNTTISRAGQAESECASQQKMYRLTIMQPAFHTLLS